jgi:dihydroxyacetone kinase
MMTADEIAETITGLIFEDAGIRSGDTVCTLINGLGATTLMELFILNRKLAEILGNAGVRVHDMEIGSYLTTQEMAGASITVFRLDEELEGYYDMPCNSPYYKKDRKGL